jgi:hypothetical protein
MRDTPDVALVADNIDVVEGTNSYLSDILGIDNPTSGTSLAAPLWAGYMARVNQQAAAQGEPPIGFANPALYAIGKSTSYHSCFHDVTSGCNTNANSRTKYKAAAGYDLCTGWGTIIGSNLMHALIAPPTESLVVKPPLGFVSFGAGGGPYSVAAETYTVTNAGKSPVSWSLVNTSSWLSVSSSGGTLNAGAGTTSFTVSLNSAASNFMIGHYTANVVIVNHTDGTSQNRQFDLYAGNGGFETGDFTDWSVVGQSGLVFTLGADDVDVAGTNALPGEPDELFVHSGLYGAYLGETPDSGSLSQTVRTTPGRRYSVSFWLTSVPFQGETTPNDFIVSWNGETLYDQTNLPEFDWTNLQYVVSASAATSTLEFDFSELPGAFGVDDVTVEPSAEPYIQSVAVAGGAINLAWTSVSNVSYEVQGALSLSNPSWSNLVSITATGAVASVSAPVGTAPRRFYRVVQTSGP